MVATATDEHDSTTRRLIASRQLQALSRLGFTTDELADRIGYEPGEIRAWRTPARGVTLPALAAVDVDTAYGWLHTQLPAGRDAERAAARAEAAGWAAPCEWVEIRDPDDRPDHYHRRRDGIRIVVHAEDLAELTAQGLHIELIAARLHVSVDAIQKRRRRDAAALARPARSVDTPTTPTDSDNTVSAPETVLSVVARHPSGDQNSRTPERRETRGEAA